MHRARLIFAPFRGLAEAHHPQQVEAATTTQPKQSGRAVATNSVLYFDSIKDLCGFVFQWQRNGVPPYTEQPPAHHTQQEVTPPTPATRKAVAVPEVITASEQHQSSIIPDDYFFFDDPAGMYGYATEWERVMSLPRRR